ncbi:hypothetical protein PSYJYH_000003 [Bacillus phage PSYJ-YH]|nr:hypothetical protein PSYJYH_000003 [Bacillus phage PSYJ-YH]
MDNYKRLFKVKDVLDYDGYTATKLELIDLADNEEITREHFSHEMSRLARYYKREYLELESIMKPDKISKYAEVVYVSDKVRALIVKDKNGK